MCRSRKPRMRATAGEPRISRCGSASRLAIGSRPSTEAGVESRRRRRVRFLVHIVSTIEVRLLERSGFVHEGYAREYLCINGIWQDHLLYARLKDDARA